MKLKLYYFPQCPYCVRVLMAIRELNITSIELCDIHENQDHNHFHIKTTGRTTVPCLYIDGKPMFESADIVAWLKSNIGRI